MQPEHKWLRQIRRMARAQGDAGGARKALRLGIGDDAALLRPRKGCDLVVTTDMMVEGVHFTRSLAPSACGWKLATRALSDLAAMGARPMALFVSCAFPASLAAGWTRGLYRGLFRAMRQAGAALGGGDLSASPSGIVLDVVGVGDVHPARALLRNGARAGDRVFVSGVLGRAAVALQANRARRPHARWELGLALGGIASAAIDLSDGLSTDLYHICEESGVGAIVEAERIPRLRRPDGLNLALNGGEDYELLFTIPPRRVQRLGALKGKTRLTEIGKITGARGMFLETANGRRRLSPAGWQHFAQN